MQLLMKMPMFDNLPRHTLVRKKDGGLFLIKCKIHQLMNGEQVPCYLGHRYCDEEALDYEPGTCYIHNIDHIINHESSTLQVQ